MSNLVKRLAKRSKSAIVIYKIVENFRLKKRVASGDIETEHGATHFNISVSESLRYIEQQFADYVNYARLSPAEIEGARILELGPGDNLGVALKFLAAGAASVVCLDRFYSKRDIDHQTEIYRALRESLDAESQERFDNAVTLTGKPEFNSEKLQTVYGAKLEEFAKQFSQGAEPFDLILSCAVLEEIYDPDPVFAAMDRLLARGGRLIHVIDLGDYGMFREQGMHPLTFLTLPESIYRRMASDSGLPNRKRLSYYVAKMKEFGYQSEFFVTSVIPDGRLRPATQYVPGSYNSESGRLLIEEIRGRLAKDFKYLDDDQLLIDGMLLSARKPA